MAPLVPPPRSGSSSAAEGLSREVQRLTREWIRLAREEARLLGLSLPQLFLLGGLRETGAIPVTRWVEMVGTSPSATTGLLDHLESDGFIRRIHDTTDRRQVLISLTPKGRRLAERLRREFRTRWSGYCRGIATTELNAARATVGRIVARMAEDGVARGGDPPAGRGDPN